MAIILLTIGWTQLCAQKALVATSFNTGFAEAGDTWNSLSAASDGKIYYSFSTVDPDQGAKFHVYDLATGEVETLGDLTEIADGTGEPAIPQGKSHANFYEIDGKLYIATHVGVHGDIEEGELAISIDGYAPYPGGSILSYDMDTGDFEALARAPDNEGILAYTMDVERGHGYGLTWPKGYFIHYDVEAGELHNLGLTSGMGEAGVPGEDFRVLGRALVVDPRDGSVYYSTATGDIYSYHPERGSLEKLEGADLRKDYFSEQTPAQPGNMGYGWRQIIWHPYEQVAYGVHGHSGYLFRFDPREPSVEVLQRITSLPSRRSGMRDRHPYGYLGFDLGPNGETLYYLTGAPLYKDGTRVTADNNEDLGFHPKLEEKLHLVTYHLPSGRYTDHGTVFHEHGSHIANVQAITFGLDGAIYTLGRFDRDGDMEMDLLRIPDPTVPGAY